MEPSLQGSIAERAEKQLSHITRCQLTALGATPKVIRRLVANGRLLPVGSCTFRLSGTPPTFEGRVMAACLDTGGVASHVTAATLLGLAGFTREPRSPIEVTVRKGGPVSRSLVARVHSSTHLGEDDIVHVGPIPTTSVARTVLGLAALVPAVSDERLRDAIDNAVRDGSASDHWLWWRLEQLRCRGRNGVTVMESILQARAGTGRTEGWLERAFLRLVKSAGLPLPVVQRRVRAEGAFVARVDFCYEGRRLAIEVNGHATHSTKRQRDSDAARINHLILAGYRVLQFTYDDIVQRPQLVLDTLICALAVNAA